MVHDTLAVPEDVGAVSTDESSEDDERLDRFIINRIIMIIIQLQGRTEKKF